MRRNFGYLLGTSCLGLSLAALPAASSPSAGTDIICHTSDPAECYPRIFQPTKDFQVIKDDQDLPPGLHVRLNIFTGEKEARLNIPIEGEDLLDSPKEQAVIVVPQSESEEAVSHDEAAMRDRLHFRPPPYEAAGKIQQPLNTDDGSTDAENFNAALAVLTTPSMSGALETSDSAFSILSDLSHDIYYGLELAKRGDVMKFLMGTMSGRYLGDQAPDSLAARRRQAASIIGHAVQNNPTALKELSNSWAKGLSLNCPPEQGGPTSDHLCENLTLGAKMYSVVHSETDPGVLKAKIYALNGLTKDAGVRDDFLAEGGMAMLLAKFLVPQQAQTGSEASKVEEEWKRNLIKIAQFTMDTFLDEDMGAELGVWPKEGSKLSKSDCEQNGHLAAEGCWEYAIANGMKVFSIEDEEKEMMSRFLTLLGKGRGIAAEQQWGGREL
ncbi:MAG: hypothetical protein M1818_000776 [Claussenomyces sp. TS43310]|nr:MAG: hypothetical protein M1818_000776 [Claussenomyces sp. TS43310]